ncbi:MAG: DUF4411 family protein [Methylococcales bacterium]|jgi:hypothetical protein|nr:DUF4411 family protein [Methylococcales bacterium]MBT7410785.1 DUF4411 family protein [Methylococcales bacterium]
MYSFDASSIIHAWDNYPPENPHFDSLWEWIGRKISNNQFGISKKALEEVEHKVPKCGEWLKDNNITIYPLTASALLTAQRIKNFLGIEEEKYTKGVGENDLFIIAIAKETQTISITEEGRQNNLPNLKSNYKIPAVCNMNEVNVECISFVELLK